VSLQVARGALARNEAHHVGPALSGTFEGDERQKVSAGDVVIIPPGMLHGWDEVEGHVPYVSVRPETDHVLPAVYGHPARK